MSKTDVINLTQTKAEEAGVKITKKNLEVVTTALFDAIVECVKNEGKVKFNEITYYVKDIPAKSGTIMLGDHKGEQWKTEAHKEIAVKASKALKQMI